MAVFRVERNKGYTVMSNHHLRNKELSLKAKGLLSQMLSLPEDWDYTLAGLSFINREKIDAIREAVKELERAGYIVRSRERDEKGRLRGTDYVIFEQPQTPPVSDLPTLDKYFQDEEAEPSYQQAGKKITPKLLLEAIRTLPEEKRKAIMLYYFEGMTDVEIGKLFNTSRSTIQYRRTSSFEILKKYLEEHADEWDEW